MLFVICFVYKTSSSCSESVQRAASIICSKFCFAAEILGEFCAPLSIDLSVYGGPTTCAVSTAHELECWALISHKCMKTLTPNTFTLTGLSILRTPNALDDASGLGRFNVNNLL